MLRGTRVPSNMDVISCSEALERTQCFGVLVYPDVLVLATYTGYKNRQYSRHEGYSVRL